MLVSGTLTGATAVELRLGARQSLIHLHVTSVRVLRRFFATIPPEQ